MPELRKDPILSRWIIISTERAKRPSDFTEERENIDASVCPFCEGNENMTPPEIKSFRKEGTFPNTPGWRVRVISNKFPALRIEGNLDKKGKGIYDRMNGVGAHEVIIETPEHKKTITELSIKNIQEVLWAYKERFIDLKNDMRIIYIMLFKNVGAPAGASLDHTHSQLIGLPTIPKIVKEEMAGAKDFYEFRGRCIFCDMITQEKEEDERLILETEHFLVFNPFASRFPFEIWILPKKHLSHFEHITKEESDDLAITMKIVLSKLERALENPPYNFIIHTTPFTINDSEYYHWHIEIIPRISKTAGFEWGTDFYINSVLPEDAANFLKEINVEI